MDLRKLPDFGFKWDRRRTGDLMQPPPAPGAPNHLVQLRPRSPPRRTYRLPPLARRINRVNTSTALKHAK